MSHVDLLVAQTLPGPARPGLRGEGGDGAVAAAAAARVHGGQVNIVISRPEGPFLAGVPVDDIEVSGRGPGPPPPVLLPPLLVRTSLLPVRPDFPMTSVFSVRPDPLLTRGLMMTSLLPIRPDSPMTPVLSIRPDLLVTRGLMMTPVLPVRPDPLRWGLGVPVILSVPA